MSTEYATIQHLIQTLTDGIDGFTEAAGAVKSEDLRLLFEGFAAERQEMADELTAFSDADGTEQASTITGALHRGWIHLKAALTAGSDHALLVECERGEDHALAAFRNADVSFFPPETQSTIASIATRILTVHNLVKELRDRAA